MSPKRETSLVAILAGFAVIVLCGTTGLFLGGACAPPIAGRGRYGASAEVYRLLLMWCGGGLLFGLIVGLFWARCVARRVGSKKP